MPCPGVCVVAARNVVVSESRLLCALLGGEQDASPARSVRGARQGGTLFRAHDLFDSIDTNTARFAPSTLFIMTKSKGKSRAEIKKSFRQMPTSSSISAQQPKSALALRLEIGRASTVMGSVGGVKGDVDETVRQRGTLRSDGESSMSVVADGECRASYALHLQPK